jgi:hypothetical protein
VTAQNNSMTINEVRKPTLSEINISDNFSRKIIIEEKKDDQDE